MKKFLICLVIILLLGGAAFFIYKNPQYNPFVKEDTPTTKVISEEEAKKEALNVIEKYYYDEKLAYDEYCPLTVCDENDKVFISNVVSAYKLKDYNKYSDLKAYLESFLTTNMISKFSTKFVEKNNKLYCMVGALSYPLIKKGTLEVTSVNVSSDSIEANVKYIVGDGQLYPEETKNVKVKLKNLENKWKIDKIEKVEA